MPARVRPWPPALLAQDAVSKRRVETHRDAGDLDVRHGEDVLEGPEQHRGAGLSLRRASSGLSS